MVMKAVKVIKSDGSDKSDASYASVRVNKKIDKFGKKIGKFGNPLRADETSPLKHEDVNRTSLGFSKNK